MSNLSPLPAPAARISAKLRRAIELRVQKGLTIDAACAEAGLSTSGWHKAMRRAAVRDFFQKVQSDYVSQAEALKETLRMQALEVAAELMATAKSEAVRARMVEFLLSEGKVPQVAVNVDARQSFAPGYEFVPRGARVVEILSADEGDA